MMSQPPMTSAIHIRPELCELARRARDLPLVVVSAPAGSGKSTLLENWRGQLETLGVANAWIDLAPLHADPAAFLEDLAHQVDEALPEPESDGFGAELRRRLPHLDERDGELMGRLFGRELRDLGEPLVLFLDDYHRLPADAPVHEFLTTLLRREQRELHVVVATRGAVPPAAARLRIEERCLEVGARELSLRADQVAQLMRARSLELEPDVLARLLAQTRGWVTGITLALRTVAEHPDEQADRFIAELGEQEDLFAYIASELLEGESSELISLLEVSALLGPVAPSELEAAAGSTVASSGVIDEALAKGLLLRERERLGVHHLWEAFLRDRLRRRLSPVELGSLVGDVARRLEAASETERAIELCIEFSQLRLAAALIGAHGAEWIERGRQECVARWLDALTGADVTEDHTLVLVRALLLGRRDAARAIDALEEAATQCRKAGDGDREAMALHYALILAMNENHLRRGLSVIRRLVALPRLFKSPEARARALYIAGAGATMRGRFALSRRLYERAARTRFARPADSGAVALGRTQLALLAGEWQRAISLADAALSDPEQRRHAPGYYAIRALRAFARGVLGLDTEESIAQLAESREALAEFRLAISEAECSAFAARLLALAGRHDEARAGLERAAELHEGLGESDMGANIQLLLALEFGALGNALAAQRHAERALAMSLRRHLDYRPWIGTLAARLLAEHGAVREAVDHIERHGGAADTPDLPLSQHAVHLARARIWQLAGDAAGSKRELALALETAQAADLRAALPDLGVELLEWSVQEARSSGLDPSRAEKLVEATRRAHPSAGAPSLRIVSLGDFRVLRDESPVEASEWRGATPQRLLQRLLTARGRHLSREQLCADFWPDAAPAKSRGNLRVALTRLRRALEPERAAGQTERWLVIDGDSLAVTDAALSTWDAQGFLEQVERAEFAARDGDAQAALEAHRCAVAAYAGPLFPTTTDDWALELRREFEQRFVRAARAAATGLLSAGEPMQAAEVARALLRQEPADEPGWGLLVEAELARGDRSAALRSLAQASEALRRELDLEPGPELLALGRRAAEVPAGV